MTGHARCGFVGPINDELRSKLPVPGSAGLEESHRESEQSSISCSLFSVTQW